MLKGDRSAVDEACDSKPRSPSKVKSNLERAIVLPLEGKGDRSAVDEVTCGPAPLREAFEPQFFKRKQWKFKPQLCYPVSGLRSLEQAPARCLKAKKEVRLAISYSPGGSPPKYHQRTRA